MRHNSSTSRKNTVRRRLVPRVSDGPSFHNILQTSSSVHFASRGGGPILLLIVLCIFISISLAM